MRKNIIKLLLITILIINQAISFSPLYINDNPQNQEITNETNVKDKTNKTNETNQKIKKQVKNKIENLKKKITHNDNLENNITQNNKNIQNNDNIETINYSTLKIKIFDPKNKPTKANILLKQNNIQYEKTEVDSYDFLVKPNIPFSLSIEPIDKNLQPIRINTTISKNENLNLNLPPSIYYIKVSIFTTNQKLQNLNNINFQIETNNLTSYEVTKEKNFIIINIIDQKSPIEYQDPKIEEINNKDYLSYLNNSIINIKFAENKDYKDEDVSIKITTDLIKNTFPVYKRIAILENKENPFLQFIIISIISIILSTFLIIVLRYLMKDKLEKIDQKLKETLQNNLNNLKKENNLIKISMKTVLNKEQNKELSEEKTNNDNNVKIGNYVLNERLGTGATAVVYKATNIKNKSNVALKILHKHLMSEKWFKERIINEIEINKILTHPNIIKILEYDIEGEQPFIAFEYVNGKSLAKILEERKVIPLDESINIWIQILEAMDYAHQKGIIHRDLKPENILIREDKVVKITDFGISKRINMTLNLTQDFVGTPWYMAPEQIKNQKVDNRTDIYSMGIIFYQMITGKLPFETSENLYSIFKSHMLDNPIGANIFEKSYMPPDIEKIIRKMIEKEPKKRYTYCYEIIQELTPHLLLFSKKT